MTKTEYIYRYNLQRLREQNHLTYKQIADFTGMDLFLLIKMNNMAYAHQPRYCFDRIEAMAKLYHIEPYELFIPPDDIVYPEDLITESFYIYHKYE